MCVSIGGYAWGGWTDFKERNMQRARGGAMVTRLMDFPDIPSSRYLACRSAEARSRAGVGSEALQGVFKSHFILRPQHPDILTHLYTQYGGLNGNGVTVQINDEF